MGRPEKAVVAAAVFLIAGNMSASSEEYTKNIAISDAAYLESGDQRILLESMAAKYCLAHTGLGSERDRIAMLSAAAEYTPLAKRDAVLGNPGAAATLTEGHRPDDLAIFNIGWEKLELVYSAASSGGEAADTDIEVVLDLTSILSWQESVMDSRMYAKMGGATSGMTVAQDALFQFVRGQALTSQILAKNVCAIAADPGATITGQWTTAQAIGFDRALQALLTGSPDLGLPNLADGPLMRHLRLVDNAWQPVRHIAMQAESGAGILPGDVQRFAAAMDQVRARLGLMQGLLLGEIAKTI